MITSVIGRIFLDAYNEREHTSYDAKTFFIEKYYPLFFDAEKYMMTGGNSPFENPKISWEKMIFGKLPYETKEKRRERFCKFISKVEENEADMSIAMGYSCLDINASTSGQVTNMELKVSKDEVYLSWIGVSLGVGIKGGLSILFSNPSLLLSIYDGWAFYRAALDNNQNLKGNKIASWNGQWLAHRYDKRAFDAENPMADFNPYVSDKDASMSIAVQSWTKILVNLSQNFSNQNLMGYVYSLGQTNITIGFIPFILSQIRRPIDLYIRFFGMKDGRQAEEFYGTAFGFDKACQSGAIGVRALEPKGLKEYMEKGKLPKYIDNEEQTIKFHTYQTWIMAMLNNEDLWVQSENFAHVLKEYSVGSRNAKTDRANKVKTLLGTLNKKEFIRNLTDIVSEVDNASKIMEIAKAVNDMPTDNVPYFLTLIRFHYAAIINLNK